MKVRTGFAARLPLFGMLLLAPVGVGFAQQYPGPIAYPNEDHARVAAHLEKARRIAGPDLFDAFVFRCITSPRYKPRVLAMQQNGVTEPTRLFDNLYSIGQNAVAAFAVDTPAGIIVIDTLNSPEEARNLLVPNMEKLGLDPHRIKYVVLTHGHGDHYGGARHLQQTYGAKVIASKADWPMILTPQTTGMFKGLVPPIQDMTIGDNETLSLGGETIRFYLTPGHTPGTLSIIFPVRDKRGNHVVGLYGGTGGGADAPAIRAQIGSLARWETLSRKAGVDVLVTNHPSHNEAIEKEELLRYAAPGATNPFLIGTATYQRYFEVMGECSRAQLARLGEAE